MSAPLSPEKELYFKQFRESPLPDVAALPSMDRVKRIETYHDMKLHGIFLTLDETRHAIALISADARRQIRGRLRRPRSPAPMLAPPPPSMTWCSLARPRRLRVLRGSASIAGKSGA